MTFNIGGGKSNLISLKTVSFLCQKITGNKISIRKVPKTSIYDIPMYVSENSKVKKIYGWKPKKKIHHILRHISLAL